MPEVFRQVFANLRANKLRSFLTMFGILWGVVSVVILSATGEGFQRGNQKVLDELGRNVVIVFPGRTSLQAGGERAGRRVVLTIEDARALARESSMIAVVSPELQRGGVQVKSAHNAAALSVHGVEHQYQQIRTVDIERGRPFGFSDDDAAHRVAIIGADATRQLFGTRESIGQRIELNGVPYTVVGKIRHKDQDSNYSGPDNDKVFIPFAAMAKDFPRPDADPGALTDIVLSPKPAVVASLEQTLEARTGRIDDIRWPLDREIRGIIGRRHDFSPDDSDAIGLWDTNLQSLMFSRMISRMKTFFTVVGVVTLALGGIGVMNIMLVAVRERTREIGVRKALGATTAQVQRQGASSPIGETVRIKGMAFEVVGVQKEKIQLANYGRPDKESIFIPYTTVGQLWNTEYLTNFVFQALDPALDAKANAYVKDVLGKRLRFNPADDRALNTFGSADQQAIIGGIVLGLKLVLGFIGVLTLAIGGVGVMNIMFVSVNERTREIGLRKALGATRGAILTQFLLEGLVTTFAGGVVGVLMSYVLVWLVSPRPFLSELFDDTTGNGDIHLLLSAELVGVCTAILMVVGLASALIPAVRASRLDPIEALRYE